MLNSSIGNSGNYGNNGKKGNIYIVGQPYHSQKKHALGGVSFIGDLEKRWQGSKNLHSIM